MAIDLFQVTRCQEGPTLDYSPNNIQHGKDFLILYNPRNTKMGNCPFNVILIIFVECYSGKMQQLPQHKCCQ